ncbi:hypothetical protein OBBRIDRAFT_709947, partial [Obba rivulosa]
GCLMPRRQVQLLLFWDAIGCPWEMRKQLYGSPLTIIGLYVDPNIGSISLPPAAMLEIIASIDLFLAAKDRKQPLREWQRLAGHLNWMLNVLPWGRPGLTELYRKIAGKSQPSRPIFLNRAVIADLTWLKNAIPRAIGIRFFEDGKW